MKAIIYLVVGIITVAVGFIVFFTLNGSGAASAASSVGINLTGTLLIPSITCWAIGGIMVIFGILGLLQGKARQGELQQIAATGVETGGIITFLDRNYSLLINNRPVYSVIEYRYRDGMGREFVKRADNIKTDVVIRSGWQVGSQVRVRYLPQDPTKCGLMFAEV
ncbi:MAG TPA: DUF3592 domain-containing protein [Chloroflexia bacterium]|nr:DUF3592 domain-containing protein [Chloroflexia bacterium]